MSDKITIEHGDCREVLARMARDGVLVDSVVTDPPYHLVSIVKRPGAYALASKGFMGKTWDGGAVAFEPATWAAVFAVMKPGAHLVAFGGTRTYHRLACAIEDAGFEIRDQIGWLYGSGFPKSHDVSKGIDRAAGKADERGYIKATGGLAEGSGSTVGRFAGRQLSNNPVTAAATQWHGWGTALKPAWEPIVLARKPLIGTVAANVLKHGTGALNIDGCRIGFASDADKAAAAAAAAAQRSCRDRPGRGRFQQDDGTGYQDPVGSLERWNDKADLGRWPANVIHDGSDEAVAAFPASDGQQGAVGPDQGSRQTLHCFGDYGPRPPASPRGDSGSAARFFYSAKADAGDRLGSKHPTVKPVDLMAYLVRMVTPPGGTVLDPFAGSGTTGMAAMREGFAAILIEREAEYIADIRRRLAHVGGADAPLFTAP